MHLLRRSICGFLLFCVLSTPTSRAFSSPAPSFWVWNRSAPLGPEENQQLHSNGVSSLYWHLGTLSQNKQGWNWQNLPVDPLTLQSPSMEIIPVLRLEFPPGDPFSPASRAQLIALLKPWIASQGIHKLQLDCDCPESGLANYAELCRSIKKEIPNLRLEITALASWAPEVAKLFPGCIDEISPMFYDLDPAREHLQDEFPGPLIDEASVLRDLSLWKKCPISWRAGLPYFTRVTLFDEKGVSLGHPRNVPLEDLVYSRAFLPGKNGPGGSFIMNASRQGVLGSTPFRAGNSFAFRAPKLGSLRILEKEALESHAEGITYFRLPDPGKNAIQSISALFHEPTSASLRVDRSPDGGFVLTNTGSSDLLPTALAPSKRGYTLRIQSSSPIWREVIPGDFHSAFFSLSSSDPKTNYVPAPLANQVDFLFSHLPAGARLSTGWIRYAAGQNRAPVQYQLIAPEQTGPWQKLP